MPKLEAFNAARKPAATHHWCRGFDSRDCCLHGVNASFFKALSVQSKSCVEFNWRSLKKMYIWNHFTRIIWETSLKLCLLNISLSQNQACHFGQFLLLIGLCFFPSLSHLSLFSELRKINLMKQTFFSVCVLELLILERRRPWVIHCYFKYGPWTNNICMYWKLIRNRNYMLNQSLWVYAQESVFQLGLWVLFLNTNIREPSF